MIQKTSEGPGTLSDLLEICWKCLALLHPFFYLGEMAQNTCCKKFSSILISDNVKLWNLCTHRRDHLTTPDSNVMSFHTHFIRIYIQMQVLSFLKYFNVRTNHYVVGLEHDCSQKHGKNWVTKDMLKKYQVSQSC